MCSPEQLDKRHDIEMELPSHPQYSMSTNLVNRVGTSALLLH